MSMTLPNLHTGFLLVTNIYQILRAWISWRVATSSCRSIPALFMEILVKIHDQTIAKARTCCKDHLPLQLEAGILPPISIRVNLHRPNHRSGVSLARWRQRIDTCYLFRKNVMKIPHVFRQSTQLYSLIQTSQISNNNVASLTPISANCRTKDFRRNTKVRAVVEVFTLRASGIPHVAWIIFNPYISNPVNNCQRCEIQSTTCSNVRIAFTLSHAHLVRSRSGSRPFKIMSSATFNACK